MESKNIRLGNGFQFGLLGGLGVLTALAIGNAFVTLASVVTYVALAVFIALGLEPVVKAIEHRLKVNRPIAILAVIAMMTAFLSAIIWSLLPAVTSQAANFISSAPDLLSSVKSVSIVSSLDLQFGGGISNAIDSAAKFLSDSSNWPTLLGGVVQVGITVFNGFFGALIVLTLTIYFMASLSRFKKWIYALAPASKRTKFGDIGDEIANSIGRYVMGQVSIALINATLGFVMMSIVGIEFSLVLACITFSLALIPLVGSISGAAIVVIVALTASPTAAIIAGVYYLVYLQIEAYVISPRIMTKAVAAPGAVVVVAALAGGALLGILGALVAIPVAASIILIIRQVWVPRQDAS
jgi:predicted PurR-regulated permease PerM